MRTFSVNTENELSFYKVKIIKKTYGRKKTICSYSNIYFERCREESTRLDCQPFAEWLEDDHDDEREMIDYSGYVLSYGAFFSEKVVYITQLLNGKIFIVAKTLRRLITLAEADESAKKALDNYLRLTEYGSVKVIGEGDERNEEEIIVSLAKTKSLKIIVGSQSELVTSEEVKVLSLSEL